MVVDDSDVMAGAPAVRGIVRPLPTCDQPVPSKRYVRMDLLMLSINATSVGLRAARFGMPTVAIVVLAPTSENVAPLKRYTASLSFDESIYATSVEFSAAR